jgi:hypothetical protein
VGTQLLVPLEMRSAWPSEVTRNEAEVHCALTQGPFPAVGEGSVHPEMAQGEPIVTTAIPVTFTRGLGSEGTACPPCAHCTVAC